MTSGASMANGSAVRGLKHQRLVDNSVHGRASRRLAWPIPIPIPSAQGSELVGQTQK